MMKASSPAFMGILLVLYSSLLYVVKAHTTWICLRPAANDITSNNSLVYFATYHGASETLSATGAGIIVTGQEYGTPCAMDCGNNCGTVVVGSDTSLYTWNEVTTSDPNLRCTPVGEACSYSLTSSSLRWKKVEVETLCLTDDKYYVVRNYL